MKPFSATTNSNFMCGFTGFFGSYFSCMLGSPRNLDTIPQTYHISDLPCHWRASAYAYAKPKDEE